MPGGSVPRPASGASASGAAVGRCLAADGSWRTLRRLSTVVTTSTPTITINDGTMPISGAHATPLPCSASRISFTPMNPRMSARPMSR